MSNWSQLRWRQRGYTEPQRSKAQRVAAERLELSGRPAAAEQSSDYEDRYASLAGTPAFWRQVYQHALSKARRVFCESAWHEDYCEQEAEDVAMGVVTELSGMDLSSYMEQRRLKALVAWRAASRCGDHQRALMRREVRQAFWFLDKYEPVAYKDEDSGDLVHDYVARDQADPYEGLQALEEAQLVRDTVLSQRQSWSEVLSDYYLEGLPAEVVAERHGISDRSVYKRLAAAREALQSSLSTSAHV